MLYQNKYELTTEKLFLKKGESVRLVFRTEDFLSGNTEQNYLLRLLGDIDLQSSWLWELGCTMLYRDIDDSLSTQTHHSRFCLRVRSDYEEYPRRAYYKLVCPPALSPQYMVPGQDNREWTFSCYVKTEDFRPGENGGAYIRLERFLKQPGKDRRDICHEADEVMRIEIEPGTRDWYRIECPYEIGEETACVLITVGVENAGGEVRFEAPSLLNLSGHEILPPFAPSNPYHGYLNWFGENLSHKEWTDMKITVNGNPPVAAQLFQRCHLCSENEIMIPNGYIRKGKNEIRLENTSDYLMPMVYILKSAQLLYEERRPLEIVSCPDIIRLNEEFHILVDTAEEHTAAELFTGSTGIELPSSMMFAEKGLHAVHGFARESASDITIIFRSGGYEETVRVERVVEKEEDGILTGTGDAIYLPQSVEHIDRFLAWYLHNGLGNFITFRPVYRWSGTRELNPAYWEEVRKICTEMGIKYCHIVDGRELPGINANPPAELLEGPCFLGRQGHERDGALCYWGQRKNSSNEPFMEELSRRINRGNYYHDSPILYEGNDISFCFSSAAPRTMSQAAGQFVERAASMLEEIPRHSGPSTLFKYFFQAGLQECIAELMYSSHEVTLSALRGASRAYGKEKFGSHLAVQWSTTPHDTEGKYRRYQLTLFICYLQGVHEINTEEGLYRIEEYYSAYDRFSPVCGRYMDIQRDFLKFINTHVRRGKMVCDVAFVHGRDDPWTCFGRNNAWSQNGKQWEFSAAQESWDLIKVFYPDASMDAVYRHPCPDEPVGFYSRTPYGNVDILPVEAGIQVMKEYPYMAFLGYQNITDEDAGKLLEYVKAGGTILFSWAHFRQENGCSRKDQMGGPEGSGHQLEADSHEEGKRQPGTGVRNYPELTGVELQGFYPENHMGAVLGEVIPGPAAECTDYDPQTGTPLVIRSHVGSGLVILVNADQYPARQGIRGIYEGLLEELAQESVKGRLSGGWLELPEDQYVGTAVYDREDGHRVIYAVNTDWWSGKTYQNARLVLGQSRYDVQIRRGVITTITVCGDIAVMTMDNGTEVRSISQEQRRTVITLQGYGRTGIFLFGPEGCKSDDAELCHLTDCWYAETDIQGGKAVLNISLE